jgi:hypothetical protein
MRSGRRSGSRSTSHRLLPNDSLCNTYYTLYQNPTGIRVLTCKLAQFVADLYNLLWNLRLSGPQGAVTIELIGHELWAPRSIAHVEVEHLFHAA